MHLFNLKQDTAFAISISQCCCTLPGCRNSVIVNFFVTGLALTSVCSLSPFVTTQKSCWDFVILLWGNHAVFFRPLLLCAGERDWPSSQGARLPPLPSGYTTELGNERKEGKHHKTFKYDKLICTLEHLKKWNKILGYQGCLVSNRFHDRDLDLRNTWRNKQI